MSLYTSARSHLSSSNHHSYVRKPSQDSKDIEHNLHELGLLGAPSKKPKQRPKRSKGVEFKNPPSDRGEAPSLPPMPDFWPTHNSHNVLSGYRPPSRSSHYSDPTRQSHRPSTSKASYSSSDTFPKRGMAAVMDLEKSRTRRDRTFIGAECAVCEEPLEHTLRGERILQLSCGHVSHEACFYEYIREFESQQCPTCCAPLALDTSRGGNVLDLEKLSSIVRSAEANHEHQQQHHQNRSAQATPTPWDTQPMSDHGARMSDRMSEGAMRSMPYEYRNQRDSAHGSNTSVQRRGTGSSRQQHYRNDSGATAVTSSGDYADQQLNGSTRRHDYDVHAMESSLQSPRGLLKNPIPAPTVTVRSEFPTISRSRQQQSLTCLVTVEVVEGKWRPDPADIRGAPPMPVPNPSDYDRAKSPAPSRATFEDMYETQEELDSITEDLHSRVENWHGLVFSRFGKLRLHGHVRVGKDRQSWQELECYLFSEMLICVKEKKNQQQWDESGNKKPRCTLKGSILIKKHLQQIESSAGEHDASTASRFQLTDTCLEDHILTLSLSVNELPSFHLQFQDRSQLDIWRRALTNLNSDVARPRRVADYELDNSGTDDEELHRSKSKRNSSTHSSYGPRSTATAPTEYTNSRLGSTDIHMPQSVHVPLDIIIVIPISSSMAGLKISLLRDTLRFLVNNLGERDRMGLVTFGSSGGGVPLVSMMSKSWTGWSKILDSIRPVGQKSLRADVVEGANVAMDLLMQRKSANPLSSILLISDSSVSDGESVDFVVSRAEAAKVAIHSFGLGLTHKPDTMIELSTRTKASYTYVKDWMMLRECAAGYLGALQTTSHQNVKLKLRLPEGSPAKFVKISGALQITKRATGRDAEASLGDLRFGDKRDILVQLAIAPETGSPEQLPADAWETIVSGLEALGGPVDSDDQRILSVEEVPLIQADLMYGDILREGTVSHLPRPSLLAITILPGPSRPKSTNRPMTPPIPPHPSVVQRRMELLTSDMLTRALTLVSRGQHERAHHLLSETRSILKGLAKGGLPPLPPPPSAGLPKPPKDKEGSDKSQSPVAEPLERRESPNPTNMFTPAAGIDAATMFALDAELHTSLEWMNHPAIFGRDSRKAVLQAIGVISSQRGYTFRTPSESLWAERIAGIKKLSERSREWRESGDEALMEES
ncbi:von Willebrand and RING finger domain-containing protein [Pseudovirgaria hyperparasitica]|uniref:von Willebrand and RING finger domain-containing protein n=1 Tax=Pseudovirgaria hyperparasitica TaxID=470096 RepID=A0A6A6WMC7_9PEZI|nr:von Willebrand and RING finger domain-containing protein [Pseudovirgaria hyperparasitica]KAF2763361.1 von Willebrand and RING finger domain-containing protein [Pseudovirgaria hyperparasitica]